MFLLYKNSDQVKTGFPVLCADLSLLLLPGLALGPQHREQESEEQKPLYRPGSDPAAEREESHYYITLGNQTHN